jgi:exopolysaccharide biosynthesis protein
MLVCLVRRTEQRNNEQLLKLYWNRAGVKRELNALKRERPDVFHPILRRHPRTAIGFNERHFFMVVVDGRNQAVSMGMNAGELAEFMALLGCTEAMNLDGGGSSTFWLQGRTRNAVSGSRERDRSDALVVLRPTLHRKE